MRTEKNTSPKFFVRRFLNKDPYHSLAAITASIDRNGYPELRLSDCRESICFSLAGGMDVGEEEWDNTFYKLDTIVEIVRQLRSALAKEARKEGWKEKKCQSLSK